MAFTGIFEKQNGQSLSVGSAGAGGLMKSLLAAWTDQVDDESDNQKIDDAVEKKTIIQGGGSGSLGIRQGFIVRSGQLMNRLLKSTFPSSRPNRGENNIRHQRVDDLGEGSPNDDTRLPGRAHFRAG